MDANQLDCLVTLSLSAYLGAKPSSQSIAVLTKVIQNATTKNEAKYRKIRLSNPKIQEHLVHTFGALDVLALVGFEQREEDGESALYYMESTAEGPASLLAVKILSQLVPLVDSTKPRATTANVDTGESLAETNFLSQEERKRRAERMIAIKRERRIEREAVRRRIQEDKQERLTRQKHGNPQPDDVPMPMGIDLRKLRKAPPNGHLPSNVAPEAVDGSDNKDPQESIESSTPGATHQSLEERKPSPSKDCGCPALMKDTVSREEVDELFGSLAGCASASRIRDTSVYRDKDDSSTGSPIKRLYRELTEMELPVNPSVWLKYDEETPQFIRFVIAGPSNTPYAHGLFAFDMKIPNDYPNSPPFVTLLTTGEGSVCFGPNLYANGKVCLSLLGTWNGPKWSPKLSSIQQVLVSIQGLILGVEHPYYLEPGYGGWEGNVKEGQFSTKGHTLLGETVLVDVGLPHEVVQYEDDIRFGTLKFAIEHMIKVPSYLESFRQEIHVHFYCSRGNLLHEVRGWESRTCLDYYRPEDLLVRMRNSIARIETELSGLSPPMDSSRDTKPAAVKTEDDFTENLSNLPVRGLSGPDADRTMESNTSIDGIAELEREMLVAAAKGENIRAIQKKIKVVEAIHHKMTQAALDGNYVRAGRLQEQYFALLSTEAPNKESVEPSDERYDGEANEYEYEYGSDVDMDSMDELSAESDDTSPFPSSYGGFEVGRDIHTHSWGKGVMLSSPQNRIVAGSGDVVTGTARKIPPFGSGCQIRFRLPDGSTITEIFKNSDKLCSLYNFLNACEGMVDLQATGEQVVAPLVSGGAFAQPLSSNGYTLFLSHPKREFNYEMHSMKHLDELGLSPSATLIVMKCSNRGVVHRGELESRLAEAQDGAMDLDGLTYEGLLELTERVGGATPSEGMDYVGLSRQMLEANSTLLSPSTYLSLMGESSDGDCRCPVCLGDFDASEVSPVLRQLHRCRHTFHQACLDTWLKTRSSCPICKKSVSEAE